MTSSGGCWCPAAHPGGPLGRAAEPGGAGHGGLGGRVHGLTGLGLAGSRSPAAAAWDRGTRWPRPGWALAGYHDLVNPRSVRRAHPPPRLPRPRRAARPARGRVLADRAEHERARDPEVEAGDEDRALSPGRGEPERAGGHRARAARHLARRQQGAVRRGVDQAEHGVGAGARRPGPLTGRRPGPRPTGRRRPAGAHGPPRAPLGQRLPVAVLDHDQVAVVQREVDLELDQRLQRASGAGRRPTRSRPSSRSRPLMATSIAASTACLEAKCLYSAGTEKPQAAPMSTTGRRGSPAPRTAPQRRCQDLVPPTGAGRRPVGALTPASG